MKKTLIVVLAALVMSGCGEKVYDASYFKANPEKAEEMLKKCEAGELSGENCENAKTGLNDYKAQAFKDYIQLVTKWWQVGHLAEGYGATSGNVCHFSSGVLPSVKEARLFYIKKETC